MKELGSHKKHISLLVLDLSNTGLKTILRDILKYENLKELNVSDNQLTELPDFLKELKFLERIYVGNNRLTELPNVLLEFKRLKNLDVSNNLISNCNHIIYNSNWFSNLEVLNISKNPLKEFPSWIWKLITLKELDISGIYLKSLPKEIGGLRNIEKLFINDCKITSFPEAIGYLKEAKKIHAKGNLLKNFPDTFKYLTKLKKLNLARNQFENIIAMLLNLDSLEHLNISENLIKELPENINSFKKLTYLNISNNKIKELPVLFYKLQFKKDNFVFKGNVFSRTTQSKINKMFSLPIERKKQLKNTQKKVLIKKKVVVQEKLDEDTIISMSDNAFYKDFFITFILPFGVFFTILFFVFREEPKQNKTKKSEKIYSQVIEDLRESFHSVLNKTKEVYVYTNDTTNLELIINVNAFFKENDLLYKYADKERAEIISDYLKNPSYGYIITLNNKREQIKQMHVYDSIIPKDAVKLFKITTYFKMTPKERKTNRKIEKMMVNINEREERKDTVFGVESGVIGFDELKKTKFNNNLSAMFMPTYINLNRDNFYFYFSPYNANVTKEEFIEAVALFNKMFVKKGNPKKSCQLKTLSVKKYFSNLTMN